jgi:hypothetical protein
MEPQRELAQREPGRDAGKVGEPVVQLRTPTGNEGLHDLARRRNQREGPERQPERAPGAGETAGQCEQKK